MKALYLKGARINFVKNIPVPRLLDGEALIKIRLSGICATDLELVRGYAGFEGIPGHEFVGDVVKVKNSKNKGWIGKRVAGNINLGCGKCEYCDKGIIEHCLNGKALGIRKKNGVFAEYTTLPVTNLFAVPKEISDKQAVFIEPLAAALRIPDLVHIPLKNKVCVIGFGRLGILISQVLSLTGIKVIVVDRSGKSFAMADKLGFDHGLIEEFKDKSFDFVIDSTGNENGFYQALRIIKPLGTIVIKSTYANKLTADFSKVVVDEIKIVGSRCGPFQPAIELLSRGLINVEDLIDAEFSFKDGTKAFEFAAKPGIKKVLLRP